MKTGWIMLPLAVAAFGASAFSSVSFFSLSEELSLGVAQASSPPTADASLSFERAIEESIRVDSRIAMEGIAQEDARKIVLESAFFSRANGVVDGTGRFWDGKAPRVIRIFIDAYGDGPDILESFPLDVRSTGKSQDFSVRAPDKATFTRFAFRFTENGEPLTLSSPSDDQLNIATVSSGAMLFASDYTEVRELLESLGMLSDGNGEAITLLEDVRRFRLSKGLKGPSFITLGDLYALRVETDTRGSAMKILPYVLWASSLGGGRAIQRPRFVAEISQPIPEDEPDAGVVPDVLNEDLPIQNEPLARSRAINEDVADDI